jgi:DNA replication protein DnaC
MLTHPTVEQLHQLGLAGMARAFAELQANPTSAALSHAEWLGLLLDREITERCERRLRARLRFARLRHQAAVEDVDYRAARGLDRRPPPRQPMQGELLPDHPNIRGPRYYH